MIHVHVGESFVYSNDGNIKRFASGARPNSILTDKDRFKLLPHYRPQPLQPATKGMRPRSENPSQTNASLTGNKSVQFVMRLASRSIVR